MTTITNTALRITPTRIERVSMTALVDSSEIIRGACLTSKEARDAASRLRTPTSLVPLSGVPKSLAQDVHNQTVAGRGGSHPSLAGYADTVESPDPFLSVMQALGVAPATGEETDPVEDSEVDDEDDDEYEDDGYEDDADDEYTCPDCGEDLEDCECEEDDEDESEDSEDDESEDEDDA